MKYKVGEEVVLKKKSELEEMGKIVGHEPDPVIVEITSVDHNATDTFYHSKKWVFTDDMIDHDKTAELHKDMELDQGLEDKWAEEELKKDNTLNHYSGELEKVVAEKNKHEVGRVDAIEPAHYRNGEIDRIEVWYLTMPFDGFRWAMKSHIDKYAYRYEKKNGIEDLDKMMFFAERLKEYELKEKEEEHARD